MVGLMNNFKLNSNRMIFMMIIILLVVISTVAYTLSTLNDTGQQVKQDITDFSRGAYDILIRPVDARTEAEKQLNIIEENYLGVGDGGITIAQWQDIKKSSTSRNCCTYCICWIV